MVKLVSFFFSFGGDILGFFVSRNRISSFYYYYICGLGESLSYNKLRQMGLIILNEVSCLQHFLLIRNSKFCVRVLVQYINYCRLARDAAVTTNTSHKTGYCD